VTASLSCDQLEVWMEIADPSLWPETAAAWDVSVWDDAGEGWAMEGDVGYALITKYVRGFTLERGRQGVWDDLLAATLTIELDNSEGVFSTYGTNAFPRIRPGFGIKMYANWDDVRYTIFLGAATELSEIPTPNDEKVVVQGADFFRVLNDPISIEYTPGVDAEKVDSRINRLLDRVPGSSPRLIAPGEATMTNYLTSRSLLDEIKLTAMSDGGVFFVDTDGTIMYMDQTRVSGRPRPGDALPPIFGDDCAEDPATGLTYELPYAAIEPRIADNEFGNVITVSNVSQGTDSPFSAKSYDQASIDENGRFLWSPPQLVICNANWVQNLADFQRDRRAASYYRIDNFECYPVHDDRLWPTLLSMRIGDSLYIRRRPPESTMLSFSMLCDGIRIEATPALWKYVVRCSPAAGDIGSANYWDYDNWDVGTWQ